MQASDFYNKRYLDTSGDDINVIWHYKLQHQQICKFQYDFVSVRNFFKDIWHVTTCFAMKIINVIYKCDVAK